jgi:hypothetical protein
MDHKNGDIYIADDLTDMDFHEYFTISDFQQSINNSLNFFNEMDDILFMEINEN